MRTIPVVNTPNQKISVTLGAQNCLINIYQTSSYGLYCDLYVNGALIIGGVICQNLNRIVRNIYLGFSGDLVWNDTQGESDPNYPGLGSQYQLLYLSPEDLAVMGATG